MRPALYYALLLIVPLAACLVERNPNEPTDRFINGDMKAYYAYLPAWVIYQDLSFSFVEDYEQKYYGNLPGNFKEFRTPAGTGVANKVTPGLAILLFPFFLLAHLLSLISGLDADGYSMLYQWSVPIAMWFYLWVGLLFTHKLLLRFNIGSMLSFITVTLLLLATNVWYYAAYDFTVAHVCNFSILAVMLWLFRTGWQQLRMPYVWAAIACLAILVSIRPTHVFSAALMLAVIPAEIRPLQALRTWLKSVSVSWYWMLICFCIIFLVPMHWKLQTGSWVIYSYGDERFYWASPRFFELLFSFRQGWLLYTPIMLFALWGLVLGFKKHKQMAIWGFLFLLFFVYVSSCWWAWWYGNCYGQRPMIDYYGFLSIPLAVFVQRAFVHRRYYWIAGVMATLVVLNVWQAWQFFTGVLHGGMNTRAHYTRNFFSARPTSLSILPYLEHKVIFTTRAGVDTLWSDSVCSDGKTWSVSKECPYGPTWVGQIPGSANAVEVNMELSTQQPTKGMRLVLDLQGEHPVYFDLFLDSFVGSRSRVSYLFEFEGIPATRNAKVYIWNGDTDQNLEVLSMEIKIAQCTGKLLR